MNERQAFEDAIDAAPHDASNHLVYADWLDEHGEPDEAAFRRAMGEWAQLPSTMGGRNPPWNILPDRGFSHSIIRTDLPDWASAPNAPESVSERGYGRLGGEPHIAYAPNQYWLHWRGYRNMEEGLRRAFMAGRARQLSRYAAAVNRLRRR